MTDDSNDSNGGNDSNDSNDSNGGTDKPRKRPRHLQIIDTLLDYEVTGGDESDPGPLPDVVESAETAPHDVATVIGNAVMYAAMSWVACCQEQAGVSVQVATLGNGLFDAEVTLADGSAVWLRVTLILETGPRLRTVVEPIHP